MSHIITFCLYLMLSHQMSEFSSGLGPDVPFVCQIEEIFVFLVKSMKMQNHSLGVIGNFI